MENTLLNGEDLLKCLDGDQKIYKKIEDQILSYKTTADSNSIQITIKDYITYVFDIVSRNDNGYVLRFDFTWT